MSVAHQTFDFSWHFICDELWQTPDAKKCVISQEVDMSESKTTTNHEQIKRWLEELGGHPARVQGTAVEGNSGVLLIDYPGHSGTQTLETISWDEFFQGFEENELAFLYQDETKAGDESRFSKLINRDSAEEKSRAAGSLTVLALLRRGFISEENRWANNNHRNTEYVLKLKRGEGAR
jgi:hypothetical protein